VSHAFGLLIESLVAALLLITIVYCFMLNMRLKRLKADEFALKATIAELMKATEIAERAVAGLKATAHECEDTLGARLTAAERFGDALGREVKAGEDLLERLSRIVVAARPPVPGAQPGPAIPAAASAHDPKALAAAAEAFAKRNRGRASARAA
jgi:hypothetical protein